MEEFSTFSVLAETYRVLGRSFGAFLRRASAAILTIAGAAFLALGSGSTMDLPPGGLAIALTVLALVLLAHFAVGWHRQVLRPEIEPAAGGARLSLTLIYMATALLILIALLLPLLAGGFAVLLLGPTAIAPCLAVAAFLSLTLIGKLVLALPAAAVGRRHALRLGRGLSSGLVPQLVLLLLLTAGPFTAAAILLASLAVGAKAPTPYFLGGLALAFAVVVLLGTATAAGALSYAFRWRARLQDSSWWRHHH